MTHILFAQRRSKRNSICPPNSDFFFCGPPARFWVMASLCGASLSHSDTPHSVGLILTSDQPDAVISSWQCTTLTIDKHHAPGSTRTHNSSKWAAADPRLWPRGHWDRHILELEVKYYPHMVTAIKSQVLFLIITSSNKYGAHGLSHLTIYSKAAYL